MIDEHTEKALSLYALGCISDGELEYLIGRGWDSLTDEEKQYAYNLAEDYDNYLKEQFNKHNDENPD